MEVTEGFIMQNYKELKDEVEECKRDIIKYGTELQPVREYSAEAKEIIELDNRLTQAEEMFKMGFEKIETRVEEDNAKLMNDRQELIDERERLMEISYDLVVLQESMTKHTEDINFVKAVTIDLSAAEGVLSDNLDEIQEIIGKVDDEIKHIKEIQTETEEKYNQVIYTEDLSSNAINDLREEIRKCQEEIRQLKENQNVIVDELSTEINAITDDFGKTAAKEEVTKLSDRLTAEEEKRATSFNDLCKEIVEGKWDVDTLKELTLFEKEEVNVSLDAIKNDVTLIKENLENFAGRHEVESEIININKHFDQVEETLYNENNEIKVLKEKQSTLIKKEEVNVLIKQINTETSEGFGRINDDIVYIKENFAGRHEVETELNNISKHFDQVEESLFNENNEIKVLKEKQITLIEKEEAIELIEHLKHEQNTDLTKLKNEIIGKKEEIDQLKQNHENFVESSEMKMNSISNHFIQLEEIIYNDNNEIELLKERQVSLIEMREVHELFGQLKYGQEQLSDVIEELRDDTNIDKDELEKTIKDNQEQFMEQMSHQQISLAEEFSRLEKNIKDDKAKIESVKENLDWFAGKREVADEFNNLNENFKRMEEAIYHRTIDIQSLKEKQTTLAEKEEVNKLIKDLNSERLTLADIISNLAEEFDKDRQGIVSLKAHQEIFSTDTGSELNAITEKISQIETTIFDERNRINTLKNKQEDMIEKDEVIDLINKVITDQEKDQKDIDVLRNNQSALENQVSIELEALNYHIALLTKDLDDENTKIKYLIDNETRFASKDEISAEIRLLNIILSELGEAVTMNYNEIKDKMATIDDVAKIVDDFCVIDELFTNNLEQLKNDVEEGKLEMTEVAELIEQVNISKLDTIDFIEYKEKNSSKRKNLIKLIDEVNTENEWMTESVLKLEEDQDVSKEDIETLKEHQIELTEKNELLATDIEAGKEEREQYKDLLDQLIESDHLLNDQHQLMDTIITNIEEQLIVTSESQSHGFQKNKEQYQELIGQLQLTESLFKGELHEMIADNKNGINSLDERVGRLETSRNDDVEMFNMISGQQNELSFLVNQLGTVDCFTDADYDELQNVLTELHTNINKLHVGECKSDSDEEANEFTDKVNLLVGIMDQLKISLQNENISGEEGDLKASLNHLALGKVNEIVKQIKLDVEAKLNGSEDDKDKSNGKTDEQIDLKARVNSFIDSDGQEIPLDELDLKVKNELMKLPDQDLSETETISDETETIPNETERLLDENEVELVQADDVPEQNILPDATQSVEVTDVEEVTHDIGNILSEKENAHNEDENIQALDKGEILDVKEDVPVIETQEVFENKQAIELEATLFKENEDKNVLALEEDLQDLKKSLSLFEETFEKIPLISTDSPEPTTKTQDIPSSYKNSIQTIENDLQLLKKDLVNFKEDIFESAVNDNVQKVLPESDPSLLNEDSVSDSTVHVENDEKAGEKSVIPNTKESGETKKRKISPVDQLKSPFYHTRDRKGNKNTDEKDNDEKDIDTSLELQHNERDIQHNAIPIIQNTVAATVIAEEQSEELIEKGIGKLVREEEIEQDYGQSFDKCELVGHTKSTIKREDIIYKTPEKPHSQIEKDKTLAVQQKEEKKDKLGHEETTYHVEAVEERVKIKSEDNLKNKKAHSKISMSGRIKSAIPRSVVTLKNKDQLKIISKTKAKQDQSKQTAKMNTNKKSHKQKDMKIELMEAAEGGLMKSSRKKSISNIAKTKSPTRLKSQTAHHNLAIDGKSKSLKTNPQSEYVKVIVDKHDGLEKNEMEIKVKKYEVHISPKNIAGASDQKKTIFNFPEKKDEKSDKTSNKKAKTMTRKEEKEQTDVSEDHEVASTSEIKEFKTQGIEEIKHDIEVKESSPSTLIKTPKVTREETFVLKNIEIVDENLEKRDTKTFETDKKSPIINEIPRATEESNDDKKLSEQSHNDEINSDLSSLCEEIIVNDVDSQMLMRSSLQTDHMQISSQTPSYGNINLLTLANSLISKKSKNQYNEIEEPTQKHYTTLIHELHLLSKAAESGDENSLKDLKNKNLSIFSPTNTCFPMRTFNQSKDRIEYPNTSPIDPINLLPESIEIPPSGIIPPSDHMIDMKADRITKHVVGDLIDRLSDAENFTRKNVSKLGEVVAKQSEAIQLLNERQDEVSNRNSALDLVDQLITDGQRIRESFRKLKEDVEHDNAEIRRMGQDNLAALEDKFESAHQSLSENFNMLQNIVSQFGEEMNFIKGLDFEVTFDIITSEISSLRDEIGQNHDEIYAMQDEQSSLASLMNDFVKSESILQNNYAEMQIVIANVYEEFNMAKSMREGEEMTRDDGGEDQNLQKYFQAVDDMKSEQGKIDSKMEEMKHIIEEQNKENVSLIKEELVKQTEEHTKESLESLKEEMNKEAEQREESLMEKIVEENEKRTQENLTNLKDEIDKDAKEREGSLKEELIKHTEEHTQEKLTTLKEEIEEETKERETLIRKELMNENQENISTLKEELVKEAKEMEELFKVEMSKQREELDKEAKERDSSFKEELEKQKEELDKEANEREAVIKEEMFKQKEELDKGAKERDVSFKKELAKQKEEFDKNAEEREVSFKEEMSKQKEELDNDAMKRVDSIKDEMVKQKEELNDDAKKREDSIKDDMVKQKEQLDKEAKEREDSIKEEFAKQKDEIELTNERVDKLKGELDKQNEERDKQTKECIEENANKLRDELSKHKEKMSAEADKVKADQASLITSLKDQFVSAKSHLKSDFLKIQQLVDRVDEELKILKNLKKKEQEQYKTDNEELGKFKGEVKEDLGNYKNTTDLEIKALKDKQDKLMILKDQFRLAEESLQGDFENIQDLVMSVDEEIEELKEKNKKKANLETVLVLAERLTTTEEYTFERLEELRQSIERDNKEIAVLKAKQEAMSDKEEIVKYIEKVSSLEQLLTENYEKLREEVKTGSEKMKLLIEKEEDRNTNETIMKLAKRLSIVEELLRENFENISSGLETNLKEIRELKRHQDIEEYVVIALSGRLTILEEAYNESVPQLKKELHKESRIIDVLLNKHNEGEHAIDELRAKRNEDQMIIEELKTKQDEAQQLINRLLERQEATEKEVQVTGNRINITEINLRSNITDLDDKLEQTLEKIDHSIVEKLDRNIDDTKTEINKKLDQTIEKLDQTLYENNKKIDDKFDETDTKLNEFIIDQLTPVLEETTKQARTIETVGNKLSEFVHNNELKALTKRVHNYETNTVDALTQLNLKINNENNDTHLIKDTIIKEVEKRKEIEEHIENIENLLFVDDTKNTDNSKLKWVLSHYNHHFKRGNPVYSPLFFTQLNGYRFQLGINWLGDKKGSLGIYLYLHKGKHEGRDLAPFTVPYTLGLQNKKSHDTSKVSFITESSREEGSKERQKEKRSRERKHVELREGSEPLPSSELIDDERTPYKPYLLPMPSLDDYVVNDTLTIFCTFKPQQK